MITKTEILMGRVKESDLPPEQQIALDKLCTALNVIRSAYGKPMSVSSGYRSPNQNASIGGAKKSYHMTCQACDFVDKDGSLDKWLSEHQDILEKAGLWQEHSDFTPGWAHLDIGIRPMKSRPNCLKRQFNP